MLIKFKHFVGTFVLIFLLLEAWAAGKVVTVQIPEQLPECPVRFIRGTLVAGDGSASGRSLFPVLPDVQASGSR